MKNLRTLPACFAALLGLLASGCGGPFAIFPGGALSGEVVVETPADWSHVETGAFALETRPSDPYSVNVNVISRGGSLYIDPAPERRWAENIAADPRVRLRVDGRVHPLTATRVTDEAELAGFDAGRTVYRLDPRSP